MGSRELESFTRAQPGRSKRFCVFCVKKDYAGALHVGPLTSEMSYDNDPWDYICHGEFGESSAQNPESTT